MSLLDLPNVPTKVDSPRSLFYMEYTGLREAMLCYPSMRHCKSLAYLYECYSNHYAFIQEHMRAFAWFCDNYKSHPMNILKRPILHAYFNTVKENYDAPKALATRSTISFAERKREPKRPLKYIR